MMLSGGGETALGSRMSQDIQIEIVVPRLPLLLSELLPNSIEDQLRLWLKLTVRGGE